MRALAALRANEPVRLLLYPVLVGAVGYLAIKGVIDADAAKLIAAALGLLLGGAVTETARANVAPKDRVPAAAAAAARAALDDVEQAVTDMSGPALAAAVRAAREQIERAAPSGGRGA